MLLGSNIIINYIIAIYLHIMGFFFNLFSLTSGAYTIYILPFIVLLMIIIWRVEIIKRVSILRSKIDLSGSSKKNEREVQGSTGGLKCIDYSYMLTEIGQDKEKEKHDNMQSVEIELAKGKQLLDRFKKINKKK